jgi:hypothetical protein
MTRTQTKTMTTTRPAAVFWHFEWALVQLLLHGELAFEQYVRPALEQRVLRSIEFFGMDEHDITRAQLRLLADWEEHQRRLAEKNEFTVPLGWRDEVSPQERVVLKKFLEEVDSKFLTVKAAMRLQPGCELEGTPPLRRRKPPRLATGRIMCDEELHHLPEIRLFFALAND